MSVHAPECRTRPSGVLWPSDVIPKEGARVAKVKPILSCVNLRMYANTFALTDRLRHSCLWRGSPELTAFLLHGSEVRGVLVMVVDVHVRSGGVLVSRVPPQRPQLIETQHSVRQSPNWEADAPY